MSITEVFQKQEGHYTIYNCQLSQFIIFIIQMKFRMVLKLISAKFEIVPETGAMLLMDFR